jgi:hypothetical protein
MPAPQSYKNHAMYDPFHHYLITPLLLLNFAFSFILYSHHHRQHPHIAAWWIVLSFTLILLSIKIRNYSLAVQNRIIRLEERLRLTALLPSSDHAIIHSLTTRQLIALRFAPDAELPSLAHRAVAENLTSKQIKEAITNWRPDLQRV